MYRALRASSANTQQSTGGEKKTSSWSVHSSSPNKKARWGGREVLFDLVQLNPLNKKVHTRGTTRQNILKTNTRLTLDRFWWRLSRPHRCPRSNWHQVGVGADQDGGNSQCDPGGLTHSDESAAFAVLCHGAPSIFKYAKPLVESHRCLLRQEQIQRVKRREQMVPSTIFKYFKLPVC